MEHHIIIAWVAVVSMTIPVAGLQMDFYVAHPQCAANLHLCVEEVGA